MPAQLAQFKEWKDSIDIDNIFARLKYGKALLCPVCQSVGSKSVGRWMKSSKKCSTAKHKMPLWAETALQGTRNFEKMHDLLFLVTTFPGASALELQNALGDGSAPDMVNEAMVKIRRILAKAFRGHEVGESWDKWEQTKEEVKKKRKKGATSDLAGYSSLHSIHEWAIDVPLSHLISESDLRSIESQPKDFQPHLNRFLFVAGIILISDSAGLPKAKYLF